MKRRKKAERPKPRYITIQIVGAAADNPGIVHEGWFVAAENEIALVDQNGKALRDRDGRFYLQPVSDSQSEIAIAKRLLRRHFYSTEKSGFGQPIRYRQP